MQQLRKAGKALNDFDKAYASRAAKDMGGAHQSPMRVMLGGSALSDIGYDIKAAKGPREHMIGSAFVAGVGATNVGYRYGLPAAGLTLAGKGLLDLMYGGQADRPEPRTLPM